MTHYRPSGSLTAIVEMINAVLWALITERSEVWWYLERRGRQKNAGLKAVTLIAALNPVSQVLW